ncbi:MAG: tetratricopeptide repeat protein [Kofleriaceae bacterium]
MSMIWGDAERAQLAMHVRALGVPVAADLAQGLVRQLDAYRVDWLAARVDAWAATRVRGEQSQDTLERRIACLERMANAMHATVRVLSTVTAAELAQARDAVTSLPEVAGCADVAKLAHQSVLPSTPEGRALDADLHRLEAMHLIGRNVEALAKAEAAVAAIERSSDRTQLPRAVFNLGWIQADLGRLAAAETQLRRALALGAAAQNHALVASVWLRLFGVIGLEQRRPDEALALEPAVRAAVLQAGDDPLHQADLAKTQGLVESASGNTVRALERFLRARELYVAARGPSHYDVAVADINIASIELLLGKLDDAQHRLETVITAFGATEGGRRHPTVGQAHQNLCAVAWRQQDWSRSERHCRAAAEVYAASVGPDHPTTAKSRMYLSRALRKLGRLEEAQTEIEQACTIHEHTLPPGNVERIQGDVYVALIAAERGNYLAAEQLARKALAALRRYGVPERLHAFTLSELARFVAHRDPAEALDFYDQALTVHLANPARDKSGDVETLSELAQVALTARQPRRALTWFAKMPESAAQLPDLRKALEASRSR